MWIDERGSEVLPIGECRRLLALGAKHHLHGHLGVPTLGAPLVLPVDYSVDGEDIVLQIGNGLFGRVIDRLVALQVDATSDGQQGTEAGTRWSVLVRGLASESKRVTEGHRPRPRVAEPGHHLVRIRSDVITGRQIREDGDAAAVDAS